MEREAFSNDACEIKIPPRDKRHVRVSSSLNGFRFDVCKSPIARHDLIGIHLVKIRVDGKVNGTNIKPVFFDGYVYITFRNEIMRAVESRSFVKPDGTVEKQEWKIEEPYSFAVMIFEKGNWMKNKKVRKSIGIDKGETKEKKEVFTKEDFLKALKKVTRPILPKASREEGKKKTSE